MFKIYELKFAGPTQLKYVLALKNIHFLEFSMVVQPKKCAQVSHVDHVVKKMFSNFAHSKGGSVRSHHSGH